MAASEHRLYFLLQRAAHRLKTEADASLIASCGLTTAQAAALTVIATSGPTNQNQIARALGQRESAITAMANRLLVAGHITRTPSPTDARAWELAVTGAGRQALAAADAAFQPVNAILDDSFTPAQIATLADGLTAVLRSIDLDE